MSKRHVWSIRVSPTVGRRDLVLAFIFCAATLSSGCLLSDAPDPPATAIIVTPPAQTTALFIGRLYELKATPVPARNFPAAVTWTSSDTSIIRVESDAITGGGHTAQVSSGRLRPRAAGRARIRARSGALADSLLLAVDSVEVFDLAHIRAGAEHTCGILVVDPVSSSGPAYCWGRNDAGQAGDASLADQPRAVQVSQVRNFYSLALGRRHSCGITFTNEVYCWGDNSHGQLGISGVAQSSIPLRANVAAAFGGVLTAGNDFTCLWHSYFRINTAVLSDGTLQCWGSNASGQVAGNAEDYPAPRTVVIDTGVTMMASGAKHTCYSTIRSTIVCWGAADHGQTATLDSTRGLLTQFGWQGFQVAAGANTTCAASQQLVCWGDLGFAGLPSTKVPTAIGSVAVIPVVVGRSHVCGFVLSESNYTCIGRNDRGQLGDGTTTSRLTFLPVAGISALLLDLAGGDDHNCLTQVSPSATLGQRSFCWGANDHGQLGDGTFVNRWAPVAIAPPRR
jgi:hypothetical protein